VHRIGLVAAQTANAFKRADDQAQPPPRSAPWGVSIDNERELTPVSVRILIAREKGEEALKPPGDAAFHARRIAY
jgi:hypothetical protein